MRRVRRRYRVTSIGLGLGLMLATATASTTSRLTPTLAKYPTLLYLMGSLGFYALVAATAGCIAAYLRLKRRVYLGFSSLGIAAVSAVSLTDLGSALQLVAAGLLIGSICILFGITYSPFIRNAHP